MNIRDDIRDLKTSPADLRKFGLLVGGVCAALGLVALLRHKPISPYLLTPGCLLVVLGAILPRCLKPVYLVWMTVAIVIGAILARVILTLFYFLVMTPVGLVARLAGRDFLSLKLDRNATTYWLQREKTGPKSRQDYERQF